MSAEQKFWDWFVQHEGEIFDLDFDLVGDRERVFDGIAHELEKVNPKLTFEVGPRQPRREFIISAGGIKRAFPAVATLAGMAPTLDRWNIIAFRPRRKPESIIQMYGKRIDPADVTFSLLDNGLIAGIHLFIPGFIEGDAEWRQLGYLLLDETLGEFDVEDCLGFIKMSCQTLVRIWSDILSESCPGFSINLLRNYRNDLTNPLRDRPVCQPGFHR